MPINGVPTAVILSMEKYAGLLETLEILSDEKYGEVPEKGKWLRTDEVFRL